MSLEKTEAVVLKMFNWSESSRTAVFFSQRFGKLPLVDRGGRSLKSRRGRLLPFARFELTFYSSKKESNGYISDCEMKEAYTLKEEGALGRLAYGSAACELLYLLLPEEEPQEALYTYFLTYLRKLDNIRRRFLPSLFVAFYLRLMSQLGYHPSLAYCVGCRRGLNSIDTEEDKVMFSPDRGGVTCRACQKSGDYYINLSAEGLRLLTVLQQASLDEAATLPMAFSEATMLVETLTEFLKYHSGLISDLKSLEFLDKLKSTKLT